MHYSLEQEVDVRFSVVQPWFPGVITGLTPDGHCYIVAIDDPQPTRIQWTGIPSVFGNDTVVEQTAVNCQVDKLAPQQFIKDRGT